ncbi:hypothetical protein OQA88_4798 [Cercophora sp. LCS_1]
MAAPSLYDNNDDDEMEMEMDWDSIPVKEMAGRWQNSVNVYKSFATVYTQDGTAGSCGNWHSDDDLICALSSDWMGDLYQAPHCGRVIEVVNIGSDYGIGGTGRSIRVVVKDTCPTCEPNHVDLSVGAWNSLTDGAEPSEFHIKWRFVDDEDTAWHYGEGDLHMDDAYEDSGYDDAEDDEDEHEGREESPPANVWTSHAWNEHESDGGVVADYQWGNNEYDEEDHDLEDYDEEDYDEEDSDEEYEGGERIWPAYAWNNREDMA